MVSSIGREPEVAVVIDKFGFNSPESRGVLAVFIVGTVIGTIFISLSVHGRAFLAAHRLDNFFRNTRYPEIIEIVIKRKSGDLREYIAFNNL